MNSFRRSAAIELATVYAAFVLITLITALRQQPITYNDGKGWEGVGYFAVAEAFLKGERPAAEAPYVYRIATPWLAARISPGDLFLGFRIVNIAANLLGVALLWLWLRRHVATPWARCTVVVLYLVQWDAPTRWIWYYPLHADPWLFVTFFGGLLLLDYYRESRRIRHWVGLCAVSVLGVLNREVALLVPAVLLAIDRPFRSFRQVALPAPKLLIPFILGLALFFAIKRLVVQTNTYSFFYTALDFLYTKGLASYTHAWFLAYGPALLLAVYDWRRVKVFLGERQDLLLYLIACATLGYLGGTDTERLLYWSIPVVSVLVGRALEHHGDTLRWWPLAILLAGGQLITSRILWTTPDYPHDVAHTYPLLQMLGSNVQFVDLFSYHGFRLKEFVCLLQWIGFSAVFLWLMRWRTETAKVVHTGRS